MKSHRKELWFDVPARRWVKTIGTSIPRSPAWITRYLSSTRKEYPSVLMLSSPAAVSARAVKHWKPLVQSRNGIPVTSRA